MLFRSTPAQKGVSLRIENQVISPSWAGVRGGRVGRLAFEIPYNAKAKELIFEISYDEELRLRLLIRGIGS